MTEGEFQAWIAFHRLWPLDDHHRIYRPAAVVASAMNGEFESVLNYLSPSPRPKKVGRASVVRKKE